MQVYVLPDPGAVAEQAAEFIAAEARAAVSARGCFTLALSGGQTPARMLRALAVKEIPWEDVSVFQVDERVAPAGSPDRNLTLLREGLGHAPLRPTQIHPMPVELPDLQEGAESYVSILRESAGAPPVLDLVHLGLGSDGHTASLMPGDPVLEVKDRDVAMSRIYQGMRRMTFTCPILDRSRRLLWVVTGSEKTEMLARLRKGDATIPAGLIRRDCALVFADRAAAPD
ncbi:MAG TPA: 6-phosphogluconolactonase [Terriglobia bacterium]|nr:6-phosphogluconolactonase [Terriglobia bacterium]